MMSRKDDLLKKSSFVPRFICLQADKDQQSEIESDDSHSQKHHQTSHQTTNHSTLPRGNHKFLSQKNTNIQSKPQQMKVKKHHSNLLQPPSKDYVQKSQVYLEKRIEQIVTLNFEKESYFGKRKEKVIEISDVSSQSEAESLKDVKKKPQKQRKPNEWDDQEELLQKYAIGGNSQPSKSKPKQINLQQQQQQQNDLANLQHLNPDYQSQQKKDPPSDNQSNNLSQMNSDDSLIIIRPKHKHTHKRLRKMVNITNRVKIESKQNGGQTQDCPICLTDLNKKDQKKKGKLPCNHIFCLKCITESSKFSNKCPYCRATFNQIRCKGKRIQVQDTRVNQQEFQDPNDEPCYICGRNNDFQRLLECEFCEYAYCHTYCDPRLENRVLGAEQPWYCASCEELMRHRLENGEEEGQEGEGEVEQGDVVEMVEGEDQMVDGERVEWRVPEERRNRNRRRQSDDEYQASDQEA